MSSLRSPSSTSTSSSSTLPSTAGGSHRSSKSSTWKSEYLPLSRDKGLSLRFIAYAAGASLPTTVKKMTRLEKKKKTNSKDVQSGSGNLPRWDFFGRDTQLFWVVVPEDRQKTRGRSRTSRERTQRQRSRSAASSRGAAVMPEVNDGDDDNNNNNMPPEISSARGPRWAGGSMMAGVVPPLAGGAAPVFGGQPKHVGFPSGVPPVVGLPGGSAMPRFGRKQTC